jgi:hypothetical protein
MKSLLQVEPRTAIAGASAVTISQPGSYYLTGDIAVTNGNAIVIAADNVTLDLNGFSLCSTEPVPNGAGIALNEVRNIHIFNGAIKGGVTNTYSGVFSGGGFGFGICSGYVLRNIRVDNVAVSGCLYDGIALQSQGNASVVDRCTAFTIGGTGINADSVLNSSAHDCGYSGIYAYTAENCYGSAIGSTGCGIFAQVAGNCYGYHRSAGATGSGTGLFAINAANCTGDSLHGIGLRADKTAENCYGYSRNGSYYGLSAQNAINCYASNNGNDYAMYAANAQNCRAESAGSSCGMYTVLAQNCFASCAGSGTGLYAYYAALTCSGSSANGTGLSANHIAQACCGYSYGSGTGLNANQNAENCYGSSVSGTGLQAKNANFCFGTSVNVTGNKYNMP